jgi:hypothetical protein
MRDHGLQSYLVNMTMTWSEILRVTSTVLLNVFILQADFNTNGVFDFAWAFA